MSRSFPPASPGSPPAQSGQYELIQRLAAGGMGEVYIARKKGTGAFEKRVALKLLLPHLSEHAQFVERFLEEARLAARMDHPNIVQVFDLGETGGRHFLAMALVEGVSLAQLLHRTQAAKAPLALPLARLIAVGLCEGLAYVHALKGPSGEALNLVHRDVNPYNLLVSNTGAVLLTDFGIAKAMSRATSVTRGLVGKLAYLAPEQLESGARVDQRIDVYAAALTLFELLTGVNPFKRDDDLDTLDAVRSTPLPDPRSLRPELSEPEARALVKGTARNPQERFGSTTELIGAFLQGPVARPADLGALVERLCQKDLERLRRPMGEPQGAVETRSLILAESTQKDPPRPGRRWRTLTLGLGGAALLGLAVLAVASRLLWLRPIDILYAGSPPGRAATPARSPSPSPSPPTSRPPAPATPLAVQEVMLPPEQPVRSPKARTKTVASRAAMRVGYLSADAIPWARLFIGGKEIDTTPIARFPLPPGRHQLIFRNPELHKEVRRTVVIQSGKVEHVQVKL